MTYVKKSVSIPDELAFKAMDEVYVRNARDPKKPTTFSEVVQDALKYFFQCGCPEVNL